MASRLFPNIVLSVALPEAALQTAVRGEPGMALNCRLAHSTVASLSDSQLLGISRETLLKKLAIVGPNLTISTPTCSSVRDCSPGCLPQTPDTEVVVVEVPDDSILREISMDVDIDFSILWDNEDSYNQEESGAAQQNELLAIHEEEHTSAEDYDWHRFSQLGDNLLGRGSSGFVHCALDIDGCTIVAVKEIATGYREGVAQIQTEMAIVANLTAKERDHFVCIASGGVYKASFFAVSPFMNGGTLRRFIKSQELVGRRPVLNEAVIRHVAFKLVNGLNILHNRDRPLVHNDLKPENVLLSTKGGVKICDFGLSRRLDSMDAFVHDCRGTVRYCAPEKFQKAYNTKVDVWALGVLLYECVVGSNTPRSPTPVFWTSSRVFEPRRDDLKCVSLELGQFILSCLIPEASLRPSAAELLDHPFFVHGEFERLSRLECEGPISGDKLLMDVVECLTRQEAEDFDGCHLRPFAGGASRSRTVTRKARSCLSSHGFSFGV